MKSSWKLWALIFIETPKTTHNDKFRHNKNNDSLVISHIKLNTTNNFGK